MTVHKTWASFTAAAALLLATTSILASQTVASPELQRDMRGIFPQSQKCGKSINLKVLSSEKTPGSKVEAGVLVSGEVREVWQATTCDTRAHVRYLFRFGPGKNGTLQIVGFERTR